MNNTAHTVFAHPYPLPIRSDPRPRGCSFETYLKNSIAAKTRVQAYYARLEAAAVSIRAALPATEGELTFGLHPRHACEDVATALHRMIGDQSGSETTGEIAIWGWRAGCTVYELASKEGQG